MKKRAQIFGQPFIFIFAIIVAALVFAFGVKIFFDLQERAEFAQIGDTVQRINEQITTFYNLEAESSNTFTYNLPNSIDCICFVGESIEDLPTVLSSLTNCNDEHFKKTINDNWEPLGNKVFWKYKKDDTSASLPDKTQIRSPIATEKNPLCFDLVKEKHILKVTIESLGNKVSIKKP